ncbi:MAG: CbtB-domain containing protein [Gammaproteobacteria bacterium]|nr:CbtB-domain containing protein [Gammaproteobacteria bacterium]
MQHQLTDTKAHRRSLSASISKPLQLVGAVLLGTIILYGAGFVNTAAVHNAAHDTRHSQGFPCH